jgi:hypothetical protein
MTALDLGAGLVGAATVVLPGWLAARAAGLPQPALAGFIAGTGLLVALTLGFTATGLRLAPANYLVAWTAVTAGAAWWARRHRRSAAAPDSPASAPDTAGPVPAWWWLPLLPVLAVVVWRAATQPLFGIDTVFRWNFLAEQMLARGTLDFYPPIQPADHAIYGWPDGIAPAVSCLYVWIYGLAGGARPAATAPLVVLQFGLVVVGVHALARRYFSAAASAWAVALAACSPLLAWAVAMGQETGLTTLAVLALLLYLPRSRAEETTAAVVCAALAAGLGALAREYGLVLPVFGFALAAARRLSPRAIGTYALVALLVAAPWYARNWVLTGNPVYNLGLGSLFPVNAVHAWLNADFHAELGWGRLPAGAAGAFFGTASVALLCAVAGALACARSAPALVGVTALFVAVWAASVGYTAAGFTYSLRVLAPAIAVAAVLGGGVLARRIPPGRASRLALAGLALLATDAALRTLTLPVNVHRLTPREWPALGRAVHDYHARPLYAELARRIGRERAVVLGPHALLVKQGVAVAPLWSPELRFLFDAALAPAEIARRLRAAGFGYVLLTQGRLNERFLARSAYFRDPADTLVPVWSDSDLVLLRVQTPPTVPQNP